MLIFRHFLIILLLFIGAITTYVLHDLLGVSTVLSASLVGLAVSILSLTKHKSLQKIPSIVYCGAFIGMTSIEIAPNYLFILMASIVSGLLYIGTKNIFVGMGGKLGTLAFCGVVIAYFISTILVL